MQAFGLRTHAWNTALRSILLLAGFPFLLTMMGYALALFLVAGEAPSIAQGLRDATGLLPAIIVLALILAAIWFAIAWFAHARILDFVTGARRITDPRQEPRLWRLTEALAISRGMVMPRLSVIETQARNAFATGLTRDRTGVTVTRGLMEALDDRELSAVLAHELSHIRNGDARLGLFAVVFAGVITLITDPVWRGLRGIRWRGGVGRSRRSSSSSSSGGGRKGGNAGVAGALILIAIVIAVMAHVLAIVLRMALSRNREYLADAGAVEMTQDADAMISALRKVEQRPDMPALPDQVRALFLHDSALVRGPRWFATHPPIEERVAALVRYAGGHDPGPLPTLTEKVEAVSEAASEPVPAGEETEPRSPVLERVHAMMHFARTQDPTIMENQAKRDKARRAGKNPDEAAPPPPSA